MAFPVVEQVLDTHVESNNTTINVNINFTTRNNGDLVIIVVTYDGENAMTWSTSGWTAITNAAGLDGSSDQRTEARYRILDGTEGTTVTVTSTSDVWAAYAVRVSGWHGTTAPECAAATGASGNVNPPSLAPSWGAGDTMWIAYATVASGDATVTGGPAGFTLHDGDNSGSGTGGTAHGIASLGENVSSKDPGTFTNTSGGWRGLTFGVRSASGVNTNYSPGSGGATLAGVAASLVSTLSMGFGQLALAGLAATVGISVGVPVGELTLAGQAPTVATVVAATTGDLALEGQATALSTTVAAGAAGDLALSGLAPLSELGVAVPAAAGALTGHDVTVAVSSGAVDTGGLLIDGDEVFLEFTFAAGEPAGLTLVGEVPDRLIQQGQINPQFGVMVLEGHAPTQALVQLMQAAACTFDGHAPSLQTTVDVPAAGLTVAGQGASLGLAVPVSASGLELSGLGPGQTLTQVVPAASLTLQGEAPAGQQGYELPEGALVLEGHAPQVVLKLYFEIPTGELAVDGLQIEPPYVPEWVTPDAIRIEAALAPSYLAAVLADSPVGYWRLSEPLGTVAEDEAATPHDGTYSGDPQLYVPGGLLDGNRGVGFGGDDSVSMGDIAAFEFTGAFSVEFWVKADGNPGAESWLVSKYTQQASPVGWYASLTTGGLVRFAIRNAAGTADAFNVTSANVTDNGWHHIVCTWTGTTAADGAKVYVDGAVSGQATAGTASVSTSNAAMLLAKRNDDTAFFTGSLDEVALYASTLSAGRVTAHYDAATVWTDLTPDVQLRHGIHLDYGMGGLINDRVGDPGALVFTLSNHETNSGGTLGWYSPHHVNCRSGWTYNIPIRLAIDYRNTTYYWRGTLDGIDPEPGRKLTRHVTCTAVDFMDDAMHAIANIPIQVQKRGDQIMLALLAKMRNPPVLTDLEAGLDTYPYGGDNITADTTVHEAMRSLAMSGLDYIGQRRDTVGGQTVFFENRSTRLFDTTALVTLEETEHQLELGTTRSKVTNVVLTTVYPRRVDSAATTVIATLLEGATQPETSVAAGATVTYWLDYTDPFQRDSRIGGTEQVTPVATTDYTMFANADGTGTNLTANFTVTAEFFASGVKLTVRNGGGTAGFITKLQVRGKGIYAQNPVIAEARDEESILTYDEQVAHVTMPWQHDPNIGVSAASNLMALYSNPLSATRSVSFYANRSHELMLAALVGDISDRVAVSDSLTGCDCVAFHIHGVRFDIMALDQFEVTWKLAPSDSAAGNIWILEDPDHSTLDETTILGSL